MHTTADRCLLLFTKPAHAGRVKTRLTAPGGVSPERAAELHAAFLGDVVERLLPATGRGLRLRLAWALDDGEQMPELAREASVDLPVGAAIDAVRQVGPDLGARLHGALAEAAGGHPGGVAAVGSDHPTLPAGRVDEAFAALAEADVVLGPADDGGYYLIALRPGAVDRRLFDDIPWSTDGVLEATRRRCAELGLGVALLPPGHDVDEPADLERLAARLAARPASSPAERSLPEADAESLDCPRTRRLLERWGRLAPFTISETVTA